MTKKKKQLPKHSKIGASSATRWMTCPGSVALCATMPQEESSVYAEEGTAAHELAEKCLLKNKNAKDFLGKKIYKDWEVTDNMADAVQVYLDVVRAELGPGRELYVEKKFHLDWVHPDLYGTNDATVEEPFGKLVVADYKHGQGVAVDVEENKQLMYYGLGALKDAADCTEIEFIIVQPRASHADGPVRRWSTTLERMAEFERELSEAAKATEATDAPLSAGSHCRWCAAQPVCPKLREHSMELTKAEFDDSGTIKLPDPAEFTKDQLVKLLESKDILDSWLKSIYTHAENMAKRGVKIPKYKLVQKTGHRKWVDEKKVTEKLEEYGTSIYQPSKLKTPAQMEKVADKELVAELCETPIIGEALVPETDKRPAFNPSTAVEDFS
jgi:hypothetical protein